MNSLHIFYNPKINHSKLRNELNNFSHSIATIANLPSNKKSQFATNPPLHYIFFWKPEWMKLFKMNTYSSAPSQSIIDVSVVNQHFN